MGRPECCSDKHTHHMLHQPLASPCQLACPRPALPPGNSSTPVGRNNLYAIESHLHELMLQSEHRTLDPEEADFFYVPTYLACFMWPIQVGGGVGVGVGG